MKEKRERNQGETRILTASDLKAIAYGINGAGGGGNVKELYNPTGNEITGLVQELGEEQIPFFRLEELDQGVIVCSVARLGRPGAKADLYANVAAEAIVRGLDTLAKRKGFEFPAAIVPVEATAGQMARATRAALAASRETGREIGILDADICGGMAVPSVPLAFNISKGLSYSPEIALMQLVTDKNGEIIPKVEVIDETDPEKLEKKLREMAGSSEMGAVWFAWLMMQAEDFSQFFTAGAVSSSIRRGRIVLEAIEEGIDPAEALLAGGEIDRVVLKGKVVKVQDESKSAPGFAQLSYEIETSTGKVKLAARNEYIVVYDSNKRRICRAPQIINVLTSNGPVQSHVLKEADEVVVITATPQCLINNPEKREQWEKNWQEYWESEQKKGTWLHPY
jgi:DUF917 family protein